MQRIHRQSGNALTTRGIVSPRANWRAWLGTMLLLLLQLQLASHLEVEHASTADAIEICKICLQLDANGSAPPASTEAFAVVRTPDSIPLATSAALFSHVTIARRARAPPLY
jgi:hypothetical protein